MNELWDWAIVDDDGLVDRFQTEDDARDALTEGGYPPECRVMYSADPGPL